MSRYVSFIFLFFSFFLLLHIGLFLSQMGVATESSRWIYEALQKKESLARSIGGEKILIISGSNALFSTSAEQITNELKIQTVNCGIHAGLRLEYILDRYLNLVGDGDLVLLPLEYSTYSYDGNTSETLSDFVTSRDPNWLLERPKALVNTAFSFNIGELLSRHIRRFRPEKKILGFYDASYINAFGDKTNIDPSSRSDRDYHNVQSSSAVSIAFTESSKKTLEEFFVECKNRGATVVLTFPVTMYFDEYEGTDFQNAINKIRNFAYENNISVLGKPDDFFLELEFFYNTKYHATSVGRSIATKRLVELLRDYLRSSSE